MSKINWRLGRRTAVVGAVCVVVLLTLAGVASAHVTVNPRTAQQGGYTKVAFRVPNERDTASTTQLEINFPTDHPIASVSTRAVPGWTSTVQKATLAKPIITSHGQITETVSKITWTSGTIAPGTFEEFDVSLGPLPTDTDQLVFKALQTYDNGEVVRWIDTAPPGAAEPEHPAPVLKLTPADTSPATSVSSATVTTRGDSGSSNAAGVVLGVVGIVLGIIGIGLGLLGRRKGPSTAAS
ncbi:MAG: YcnI family protein [Pseudonocardiaceae bacterium]